VATTTKDIYGGRDPRDVPTYSIKDAARFLLIPGTTLHAWVTGQTYVTKREGRKRTDPVIRIAAGRPPLLSFWNLAEAYVLAGIRRHHGVSLQSTRRALAYVGRKLGHKRPLIEQDFLTNGADLFIEKLVEFAAEDVGVRALVNASRDGQLAARELLAATLKRVERDTHGLISRIYPWAGQIEEPKHIEIDPRRAFGRPVVAGTSVPTEALAERFRAGDSLGEIARDFRLSAPVIESALRWEMSAAAA
jgi:uncharacterized protein (DUF433 family)